MRFRRTGNAGTAGQPARVTVLSPGEDNNVLPFPLASLSPDFDTRSNASSSQGEGEGIKGSKGGIGSAEFRNRIPLEETKDGSAENAFDPQMESY